MYFEIFFYKYMHIFYKQNNLHRTKDNGDRLYNYQYGGWLSFDSIPAISVVDLPFFQ